MGINKKLGSFIVGCVALGGMISAQASVIHLDFENIAAYPNDSNSLIQQFYNGGTASNGNSGADYGISFSANAAVLCLNSLSIFCSNTSRGGLGPGSEEGGLFFLSESDRFINIEAGFNAGLSFNYVSLTTPGSVSIFDDLHGTGNLLATLDLLPNAGACAGYNAGFCPFSPTGIAFTGTAKSVSFAGIASQIVFDDITFGSDVPGPDLPAPATLVLFGLGLAGLGWSRHTKRAL